MKKYNADYYYHYLLSLRRELDDSEYNELVNRVEKEINEERERINNMDQLKDIMKTIRKTFNSKYVELLEDSDSPGDFWITIKGAKIKLPTDYTETIY